MSEQDQNSQKTVVAFIAGLLVGGLLVWVFTDTPADEVTNVTDDNDSVMNEDMDDNSVDTADTNSNSSDNDAATTNPDDNTQTTNSDMTVGEGELVVADQGAGSTVVLESAVFPNSEGWIGIRDYQNDELGNILGVARFSKEQGLIPTEVELVRNTEAGKTYAAVFFTESGDREFSLANDVQIGSVVEVFTAE